MPRKARAEVEGGLYHVITRGNNRRQIFNSAGDFEVTSETYPSGRALSYAYDEGGRLSSVGDGTTTFASSFTYASHGGLTSETWGNTSVHTMSYNRRLQASQAKLSLGSSVLQQYDYGYGEFNTSTGAVDTSKNNGQIGKITSTIGTSTQWLQGFQYDELGRLKNVAEYQSGSMSSQTYSQGYTFDRYGNRFQSANSTLGLPAVSSSEINAATNRFINSGSTPTTYDGAGNITTDTKFRGMNYSYDANGRMTFAETTNHGTQQTSTYDATGQRVKTSVTVNKTTTTRTMVYDIFGQEVADYSGSSGTTLERENIYRGGQLLATYEAGSSALKYVLSDIQGSTRAIMNNSGGSSSVIARHDYLPFGEEISSGIGLRSSGQGYGATDTNRWKYGLTERDDTTGLDHTWWRKYENLSGRWTSPDPYNGSMAIANPQSFNRYNYVRNDPVNLIDPWGLDDPPPPPGGWPTDPSAYERVSIYTLARYDWSFFGIDIRGAFRRIREYERQTREEPQSQPPKKPTQSYAARVAACCIRCFNAGRLDNVIRDVGKAAGQSTVGEVAAELTVVGSIAAIGNEALNLSHLGRYPRPGVGGPGVSPAGSPTTWQHTLSGEAARSLGRPMIGRVGRLVGRAAQGLSLGMLAFEAGYTTGQMQACAAACAANPSIF